VPLPSLPSGASFVLCPCSALSRAIAKS
jgi:hypothetical protein